MSDPRPTERTIFLAAIERASAAERATYLDAACAGDDRLRADVDDLLAAHDRVGAVDAPPQGLPADRPVREGSGTVIGPYKLLEQIGEGGFGVVFLAEQTRPVRRQVALKVLKAGMDTRQVVARFEAERQALALMDHPHIAQVFDGGVTESGRPHFVMELVKGVPITDFCDRNRVPPRQRLELFVQVCQAVQHAHQKGVIHRDLKPSNVLVASHDGTPVVKVIDFGVAKALGGGLTDKTLFTGLAQMVGTPPYMSPEQAGQSSLDVDTRTDVYALGVLLYELLTGTTPFDKDRLRQAGCDELRRIIREEEPPSPSTRISTLGAAAATVSACRGSEPRKLSALVRGELDWIVMRALEKDRTRRYETASALATDVRRYLADEPVQACPPSAWYRFRKLARRQKRALATIAVLALAAVVGVTALAVSTGLVWRANRDLTDAVDRERLAVDGERREVYFQRITVAHRELSVGNVGAASRALGECPDGLRGWEWHYLTRLCKVEPLILRDSTEVYGVAFSPDGGRIASVGKDGKVKIWDSRTGRLLKGFQAHDAAACGVAFHPDGRHLASAGADRLVKVWDLEAPDRKVWGLRVPDRPVFQGECDALRKFGAACTVAFRPPDGRHLAAGCDGEVRVWDWDDRRLVQSLPGPEYHSIPVAFSPDGRLLTTGGTWQQGLTLWDVDTWQPRGTLDAHRDRHPISALAFGADGGRLASASLGRNVKVWDTATCELLQTIPHTGNVLTAAFSLDGRRLVSAGEDKLVHVWDVTHPDQARAPREVLGLQGHRDMCGCVAFSPDGWRLASASHDKTIIIWDATPLSGTRGQEVFQFDRHDHEVRSVAVSPDGRRIVSAGNGTSVLVWDATTGRVSHDFPGHTAPVFAVAWHPDGKRIATAGSAGRQNAVKVWDAADGRPHFDPLFGRDTSAGPYQVVAFSPDRRYLVTGQLEGAVQVWDAETGQKVRTLVTHEREIRALVFSPDGKQLASASGDGEVKLWDATHLGEVQGPRLTLQARIPGPGVNVAFSPDGRRLATGGEENTVKVWKVEKDKELLTTLKGHVGEVYAVAFGATEEGRWIASGGEDCTVKVWDSRTGKLAHSFRGHTGLISSLAFSPDGKRLYSGSRDTTVKVWDLTPLGQFPER